ncbi:MAG: ABC transporter substrate-binding protein [Nitrososphaerales archaeon]
MQRNSTVKGIGTAAAAGLAIVLLIVGVAAGYFAGAGTVAPVTTTQTQTATITQTQTVAQTQTVTTTQTVGAGATVTQTVTQTATQTITQPVTQTATSTVTRTVTATATAPAGLPEKVKIGVLLPLSGELGAIGQRMLYGAHIAAKIVNDSGGIGGRPVQIVAEDTAAVPDKALDAVKKLIEVQGVQVIVGPATSVEVATIAKYLNDRKVPAISMSATAAALSNLAKQYGDTYFWRVVGSDSIQARAIADIMKQKDFKRIVTFVVSNDYGIGMEQMILSQPGIKERHVLAIRYDPTKGDYRTELEQVKAANPDVIFYALWVESGKIVFRQALDLGLDKIPTMGGEGMADEAFFEDPRAAEYMVKTGLFGTRPTYDPKTYSYQVFYNMHQKLYGAEPSLFADYTYDATMVAILAVGHAGAYEGAKIKNALALTGQYYIGATGMKALDPSTGDLLSQDYLIWRVELKDGKPTYNFNYGSWSLGAGVVWK